MPVTTPAIHPALDPMTRHPMPAAPSMAYLKPLLADHPKIEAGDYSYIRRPAFDLSLPDLRLLGRARPRPMAQ